MKHRPLLSLALAALLGLAGPPQASAQLRPLPPHIVFPDQPMNPPRGPGWGPPPGWPLPLGGPRGAMAGERPSHRPILGPDGELPPADARLDKVRELMGGKGKPGSFPLTPEMQELAKQLLKDPKMVDSIRRRLKPEDLARLKNKMDSGQGIADDPAVKDLLKEGAIGGGSLSKENQAALRKWVQEQRKTEGDPSGPDGEPNPRQGDPSKPTAPSKPGAPVPEPAKEASPWDRLERDASRWMDRNADRWADRLDRWFDSPDGQSWRDAASRLATRLEGQSKESGLSSRARGLADRFPKLAGYMPKNVNVLRGSSLPRVPRVRGSLPSLPSGSAKSTGGALLWVAFVAVLAVVLWRSTVWYRRHAEGGEGAWRLGPWPVRPGAVRTQADLIRAFEYLGLLYLGRAARTRHHLDVGAGLAGHPSFDAARQQAAADELTRLYEQARYAPADEPLPPEALGRARQELSYLAGVAGA